MATATPLYGTPTAVAISLASLVSDTALLIGRQSDVIDNTSVDAIDILIGGKITLGTSPTTSRQVEIWAFAAWDHTTPQYAMANGTSTTFGAADAAATVLAGTKSQLRLVSILSPTINVTNQMYTFGPVSIAAVFDGVVPPKFGLWVTHNTAVNLNSTAGNHEIKYTSVKYESS